MKNKKLILIVVATVLVIGAALALILIPGSPLNHLLQNESCTHNYGPYTLHGTPTYEVAATAERVCTLCQKKQTQSVYAATGLSYETDEEGLTHVTSADNFTGTVLYLSAKQESGDAVHVIDEAVFAERNIEFVFIEDGILSIGDYAFAHNDALRHVRLPVTVTTYGCYTFANCSSLTSVELPSGITKLGVQQFYECTALTEIALPDGIVDLPIGIFFGCSELTSIRLPNTLVNIGGEAFSACAKLSSIEFPETLKEIYPSSFAGCTSLETLILPGLQKLHYSAFIGCTGLRSVFLSDDILEIEVNGADGPFFCCDSSLVLYTDAAERPSSWDKHFNNFDSNVSDEDGGELDDSAYHNLKVVYNCPLSDFPG